jgi:hypothetical protein
MKTKLFRLTFFLIIIQTFFVLNAFADKISVEPTWYDFESAETAHTFTITNNTTKSLYMWYVDLFSPPPSWIGVSPSMGFLYGYGDTDNTTVSVDRSYFANPGTYTGTITFTASDISPPYVDVNVTVTVPDPQLSVTPTSLNFGNSTDSLIITVKNEGGGTLNWNAGVGTYTWIGLSPNQGTLRYKQSQSVTATVDRRVLSPGSYSGTISFTSNAGGQTISVSMVVPNPQLSVTPTSLNFGSSRGPLTITVTNAGGGQLNWNVSGVIPDWLDLGKTSGILYYKQSETVNATVDWTDRSPGSYSGTISFTSNGGNRDVSVSMVVPNPQLSVTPTSLDFGSSTDFLEITVKNTGAGTLNWNASVSTYTWIRLSKTQGSLPYEQQEIVWVRVDGTGLKPGTHSGTINFKSNGGNQSVAVSMSVPGNPNAPTNLGPKKYVDGSWVDVTTPTLEFTQSDPNTSDTLKYTIQVDTNSDFSSPVVNFTSELLVQGATNYACPSLSDGSYYWRVMSTDDSGRSGSWATANNGAIAFRVDTTVPGLPVISAKADDGRDVEPGDSINAEKLVFTIQGSHDYYYKWNTSESDVVTSTNTALIGPQAVVTLRMDKETSWYLHVLGWNHCRPVPTGQTTFGPITYDLNKPTVELKVDEVKSKILHDGEIVGVFPDTGMEAEFSKVMDTDSVKGIKLMAVKDNLNEEIEIYEEVSLGFEWEGSTKTVITPKSELKKNHIYKLEVTTGPDGVKDLAGNPVKGERELIFRTILDHTKKNVVVKSTDVAKPTDKVVMVTLEANALKEDGYLIINTEPLSYHYEINPQVIKVANEKSIANGWYPIEGCLWEIKACKKDGKWMRDRFAAEVRINFPYGEDNGVVRSGSIRLMEETLLAYWLDEEHSIWVRVPGSRVDRKNKVVITGEIPNFSVFALMGTAVYDLSDAYAYPVPWKPNDGKYETGTEEQGITFTNLSAEGVIRIYTISGELVREYGYKPTDRGKWTWDVKTSNGEKVFSGVHIYYIENEKGHKTGKLVIIR